MPQPTQDQIRITKAVVSWYLSHYFQTEFDIGVLRMYCQRDMVGHFAVHPSDLRAGRPAALFRVLIATAMFQRQRDGQVLKILREMRLADARRIRSLRTLLSLVDASECPHMRSVETLASECDLGKHPDTKSGMCFRQPRVNCHLKRDTVALRRYGYFGKVPTSIALSVRESGSRDLRDLRRRVLREEWDPGRRARRLESELSRAFRVDKKIANMFLSAVCNPDLNGGHAPWAEGIAWSWFVVVDSNVDLFLRQLGHTGPWTYEVRREFVFELARRIDLATLKKGVHAYNPRIIQQAIYTFMSKSNRLLSKVDCRLRGEEACAECPTVLRTACPCRS